jgi:hypothetical protein
MAGIQGRSGRKASQVWQAWQCMEEGMQSGQGMHEIFQARSCTLSEQGRQTGKSRLASSQAGRAEQAGRQADMADQSDRQACIAEQAGMHYIQCREGSVGREGMQAGRAEGAGRY